MGGRSEAKGAHGRACADEQELNKTHAKRKGGVGERRQEKKKKRAERPGETKKRKKKKKKELM